MKKTKKKKNKNPEPEPSRRNFFRKIWTGLGILALAEFAGVGLAFLSPRKHLSREGSFGGIVEAGPVDDFGPDSVTAFVRGRFYLSRLKDCGFLALSRSCTHLGCTVPWYSEKKKFICPCHSSSFDIAGEVISPPAPRALDLYRVFIENGIIKVDTGRKIRRSGFEAAQVTYAS